MSEFSKNHAFPSERRERVTEQLQFEIGRPPDELEERILEALGSNVWGERDKEILRAIAGHKGAANAIRSEEISNRLGFKWCERTRRQITSVVETAVMLFRIPIGGLRMKPYGYFVIVSRNDLDLAIQPLMGEFYALLRRIRALTSKQDVARLFGQAMLKLEKEQPREAA